MENNETVTIHFTEELLEEWTKLYFKSHPRARKRPIKYSSHPSINVWCILPRISCNTLKQNWKSFTEYVVDRHGFRDLGILKCKCKVIIYRPNNRPADLDNVTPKFVMDGLISASSGVLIDDNCNFIKELTIVSEIRKGKHEMDIIFYDIDGYDKDLLFETREKEQQKNLKRQETMDKKKSEKKIKKKKIVKNK